MAALATLTDNQRRIVGAPTDRCVLVNAGPGTGKTFVLVERVVHLLDAGHPLDQLLLVTFTRKAAQELRERLGRRLLVAGQIDSLLAMEAAWVTNFHGLCGRLLREFALDAGHDPDARVQDEVEAAELATGLRRSFLDSGHATVALTREAEDNPIPAAVVDRLAWKVADAVAALGAAGEHLQGPRDALLAARDRLAALADDPDLDPDQQSALADERQAHACLLECLPDIAADYERAKDAESLLDYVDLQTRAIALLATPAGDRIRARFPVVLVDEFQDTNRAQLELLRRLTSDTFAGMMAVGDERQSIYAFRGARVDNIRQLPDLVAQAGGRCDQLELYESFRSYQEILDLSTATLRAGAEDAIPDRTPLAAVALGPAPDDPRAELPPARVLRSADRDSEATAIADFIATRVGAPIALPGGGTRPLRWGDCAILMRSVGSARAYEDALIARGIPYRTFGGSGFFDRAEILDLLAYLQVIANPYDSLALVRILQNPPYSLSQRSLYELANAGRLAAGEEPIETDAHEETQVPGFRLKPWDAIRAALDDPDWAREHTGLQPETLERLAALRHLVERYLTRRETVPVSRLLLDVLAETGYGKHLQAGQPGETALQSLRRRKNVERLLRIARRHEDRHVYGSLRELVSYLTRAFDMSLREEEESLEADDRVVNLMSIHQAKGKEWPVVCIAGLIDRTWPMKGGIPSDLLYAEDTGLFLRREVLRDDDDPDAKYAETLLAQRVKADQAAENDLEERRVLFVAMTRAKHQLVCCGHGARTAYLDRIDECLAALPDHPARGPQPPTAPPPDHATGPDPAALANDLNSALSRLAAPPTPPSRAPAGPRGVHLSFSQIDLYDTCPRRYQYTHVLPLPGIHQQRLAAPRGSETAPAELSAAELGTVFHDALERWASDATTPLRDLAEQAARDRGWPGLSGQDSDRAAAFARHFEASSLADRRPSPDELEVPFTLLLEDPAGHLVSVTGSIDRIDPLPDGTWVITDYKTNRGVEPEKYLLQLSIYRLAMETVLGKPVARTQAYFVRFPEGQGLKTIDPLSHDETRARILATAAQIQARDFTIKTHPGKDACWRCPYGAKDGFCPEKALA